MAQDNAEKKWTKTPVLAPGEYSALTILKRVKKIILDEPKRLNMKAWVAMFKGEPVRESFIDVSKPPACGTVACLAGWINVATHHPSYNRSEDPGNMALKALGFKADKCSCGNAFCEVRTFPRGSAAEEIRSLFGDTHLKAAGVATQIDRIIEEHGKELKETKVRIK